MRAAMPNINFPTIKPLTEEEIREGALRNLNKLKSLAQTNPSVENAWLFKDALNSENPENAETISSAMKCDVEAYLTRLNDLAPVFKKVENCLSTYKPSGQVERKKIDTEGLDADDYDSTEDYLAAQAGTILPTLSNLMLVWASVAYHYKEDITLSIETKQCIEQTNIPTS